MDIGAADTGADIGGTEVGDGVTVGVEPVSAGLAAGAVVSIAVVGSRLSSTASVSAIDIRADPDDTEPDDGAPATVDTTAVLVVGDGAVVALHPSVNAAISAAPTNTPRRPSMVPRVSRRQARWGP